MTYQTLKVRFEEKVCFVQLYRPEANNTINDRLIEEFHQVLNRCEADLYTVVVLEGLPEVFCSGADFQAIHQKIANGNRTESEPDPLYGLWLRLATGPYVTVSHVRGRVNAGGIGFVAASDIVIANSTAQFSLSELLFGLFPACVLPFLIRRIGVQKGHYLTLMTWPIDIQQAYEWGLVDAYDTRSDMLLRKHIRRLMFLSKSGIDQYKQYMNQLNDSLYQSQPLALAANKKLFVNPDNLERIYTYVETGRFPWESEHS
ncbi:enoyl-CoA hydratase/isomerase [Bacillus sp. RC252]|uniref:enoyl-CoA hydratase/isomerase n=1 Tax=Bacillus sp. RC252 TaxID=3156289 RepID=UPI0038337E30